MSQTFVYLVIDNSYFGKKKYSRSFMPLFKHDLPTKSTTHIFILFQEQEHFRGCLTL
jgi:hypothetical protein